MLEPVLWIQIRVWNQILNILANLDPNPVTNPDPELYHKFWENKIKNSFKGKHFTSVMAPEEILVIKSLNGKYGSSLDPDRQHWLEQG